VLHHAAYDALGLRDWEYGKIECDESRLPSLLEELAPTHAGLSLTMPLKNAVVPLLTGLRDAAAELGAVNTVIFTDEGSFGYNTDVIGAVAALRELGCPPAGRNVLVLGGGGAARAVLAALASCGAGPVTLALRQPTRGRTVGALGERLGLRVAVADWSVTTPAQLTKFALVISTVPVDATSALAAAGWPAGTALFDLAYSPSPTELAAAALSSGARVLGGLPMLVAQAAAQVELMTGAAPPVDVMRRAGDAALRERSRVMCRSTTTAQDLGAERRPAVSR
jgi:shikimate dehydrogenase